METILNLLFSNNSRIVLCGDINVNYLTNNDKKKKLNLLLASHNLLSTVNFPTRIQNGSATAIDNTFIDASLQGNYVIYPINGLSDHNAQLIVLTEAKTNVMNGSDRGKRMIRKIDKVTTQNFKNKLNFETWNIKTNNKSLEYLQQAFDHPFPSIKYHAVTSTEIYKLLNH
jgi:hypothetical protein